MKKLEMFCVTNKLLNFLDNSQYNLAWVDNEQAPENYLACNGGINIFYKEKFYSELTFHYWYWKNLLNLDNPNWVGFCQKRRFWVNKNFENIKININNFENQILKSPPNEWEKYDSIICEPIFVNKVKKIKMLKRGFWKILKKPSFFFNEAKQSINFHFDMHHGDNNLKKAINLIEGDDKKEFLEYVENSISFNPHIMFISNSKVINRWFNALFPWLERCENEFGFSNLKGYDTQRLYAYLAERYLSFWFKKNTKYLTWPWKFFDASQK